MKRKEVLQTEPKKPKKKGRVFTTQLAGGILILNYWEDKKLQRRYCMNTGTHEYETYHVQSGTWNKCKLDAVTGENDWYRSIHHIEQEIVFDLQADEELVDTALKAGGGRWQKGINLIDSLESDYLYEKRERTELNRRKRVDEVMNLIPDLPDGFGAWVLETAGNTGYIFHDKTSGRWTCSECGKSCMEKYIHRVDGGKKVRHNDRVICPRCKKEVQAKKLQKQVTQKIPCMVLQDVDAKRSVARHLDVEMKWSSGGLEITLKEHVRILLLRSDPKYACDIYWNQFPGMMELQVFDNKGNPANRRMKSCYLYPEGIGEALKGTEYEGWARLFGQMAAAGRKLDYNRMMCARSRNIRNTVEYLFKGRFYRLLEETANCINYYGAYFGTLDVNGRTIEEVFGITDRQKINRIRECDGGEDMLEWLRWSEKTGKKIGREEIEWLNREHIGIMDIAFIQDRMTPLQVVHYVMRQQEDGYKGKTAKAVLAQWKDYLSMCRKQNKNVMDAMIYRPRELKRRHNEIVEEIRRKQMMEELTRNREKQEKEAQRMREKFPGAEENLRAVKEKYEYRNETYMIIVPQRLVDIMAEGNALHHCAGASDRYFDRIMQHETYICFLRKAAEPDVPYYTIEVEPGGTIRQHRGYLDEEPGIEEILPFLKEWQKEIRKRLSREDKERAKVSAVKRMENIRELTEKNNTRVLQGLMEDFMEAV